MEYIKICEDYRSVVNSFIIENWGSPIMISKGKSHSIDQLPGYVVKKNNRIVGLITYQINGNRCEIVSLDSLFENHGIGSRLVNLVIEEAVKSGCKRCWLITSNDNTRAIKFYQKRGFDLVALHVNAIDEARRLKPEIPLTGFDNIPIKHELEFELKI
jgi:ribosomal protein S18 acetylase RimI-like enzyme